MKNDLFELINKIRAAEEKGLDCSGLKHKFSERIAVIREELMNGHPFKIDFKELEPEEPSFYEGILKELREDLFTDYLKRYRDY